MASIEYSKGLEGVIAAESSICRVDGENGKLYYMGYSISDLARNASYEEVTYLLLYGELPTREELEQFTVRMRSARVLPEPVVYMVREFPRDNHPMELLQSVISYLSGYVAHKIHHNPPHCNCRDTLHQVSQIPSVIAAYDRFRNGKDYIPPRDDLNHGANFLYMLHGEAPDKEDGDIMDRALVLHAEHDINASTFTARVVASTMSTCYSSISAAMGALFGSLHGGANEKVIQMIDEIGSKENAKAWVNNRLDAGGKVPGFGHRIYKTRDPRSIIMEEDLKCLSEKHNDWKDYEILQGVQHAFRERMEEKGKPLYPNVDFLSGSVYRHLGISTDLFTPLFAMARVAGWLSHILEQRVDNKLYRPRTLYVGHEQRDYVPIEKRAAGAQA